MLSGRDSIRMYPNDIVISYPVVSAISSNDLPVDVLSIYCLKTVLVLSMLSTSWSFAYKET